jgi:RNA polymerase sigma factor for flagellar operon FliA
VLQPLRDDQQERVLASRTFVEALARRLAASMPGGVDVGDLVQDGMIGLIDAMHRFDEGRGIRFETFAERRVRGAMIDALRKDAWPRGVRRQRRDLEAARESLRGSNGGAEPSIADLAAHLGTDADRLGRTILRITTIEATSAAASSDPAQTDLPAGCVPSAPPSPDENYRATERRQRLGRAMSSLAARDRQLLTLYYFRSATMKDIGSALGVNESRVSQLHARALTRLKQALLAHGYSDDMPTLAPLVDIEQARTRRQTSRPSDAIDATREPRGVVLPYPTMSRTTRSNSARRNGLASQRQPVSSRKPAASAPVTSPVTKMTRRA